MSRHVLEDERGRRLRLSAARAGQGVWIGWPGGAAYFEPEQRRLATASRQDEVRAPMTGKIVSIAVAPGASVAKDELLVILEAMKMEYRLTAPRAGEIAAVHCAPGELVDLGKALVSFTEPA